MQTPVSFVFNNRFCRIWLADAWHIGMSRKGTCILSYPLPFFHGRNGQGLRRVDLETAAFESTREPPHRPCKNLRIIHRIADISLLFPWQVFAMFIHKRVLSYPNAFGVGNDRASPVTKKRRECHGAIVENHIISGTGICGLPQKYLYLSNLGKYRHL